MGCMVNGLQIYLSFIMGKGRRPFPPVPLKLAIGQKGEGIKGLFDFVWQVWEFSPSKLKINFTPQFVQVSVNVAIKF